MFEKLEVYQKAVSLADAVALLTQESHVVSVFSPTN
jgi:hypothetical protein